MWRGFRAGLAVMALAAHASAGTTCPLEQSWQVGDAYDWQQIELLRGGRGEWFEADRHKTLRKETFTWQRDGSKLVVTSNGVRREVHFTITRAGDTCTLRFDAPPLDGASTEFYASSS